MSAPPKSSPPAPRFSSATSSIPTRPGLPSSCARQASTSIYKTTVGDNEARVRGVIELGMTRSDAIIVTGGLGPTVDDITRQAIAAATGRDLILHEGALATLQARFVRFGVQMTANNRQQALIPEGALLIENPVGTAPGFIVETERCAVIAVPGVPREMKHLMTETVLPYLRTRVPAGQASSGGASCAPSASARAPSTICWATSCTGQTQPSGWPHIPANVTCASPPGPRPQQRPSRCWMASRLRSAPRSGASSTRRRRAKPSRPCWRAGCTAQAQPWPC